jgi:hypothetical protein
LAHCKRKKKVGLVTHLTQHSDFYFLYIFLQFYEVAGVVTVSDKFFWGGILHRGDGKKGLQM